MGVRTGEQLLQSLRDGRQLFIDGERIEDGDHRSARFAATAQSLAQLCDLQHGPSLIDRYSIEPPDRCGGARLGPVLNWFYC